MDLMTTITSSPRARVACAHLSSTMDQGYSSADYLPLQSGHATRPVSSLSSSSVFSGSSPRPVATTAERPQRRRRLAPTRRRPPRRPSRPPRRFRATSPCSRRRRSRTPSTTSGAAFTAANPDAKVTFSFDASSALVQQITQGAPADVFASADTAQHGQADRRRPERHRAGDLRHEPAGDHRAAGQPEGHHRRRRPRQPRPQGRGLRAARCPCGKYAKQILDAAGVTVTPVSLEQNVKGVVTKVTAGEADAGIVYITDVTAAGDKAEGVDHPRRHQRGRPVPDRQRQGVDERRTSTRRSSTSCSAPTARRSWRSTASWPP